MTLPAIACLFGLFAFAAETAADTGLPRSTPEAQGISSTAIMEFIAQTEAKIDALHSFMLVRHGQVIAEGWWAPYVADKTHEINSITKSFTSTVVGLAIAEHKLNLDDPVLKFFPDEAPEYPGKDLKSMTVRHLLRMSTGHDPKDVDAAFLRVWPMPEPDLIRKFFAMPIKRKPGTGFVYDSVGSHVLSAIVEKATGLTVREYLRSRLFAPLGIVDLQWDESAQGIPYGGFGLHLHTEDIAKFGQLHLQMGRWHDQELIPPSWVKEATSKQNDTQTTPAGEANDGNQGYGYQFWLCRHGFYRGDGAFGQLCIVMPKFDAVLVITANTQNTGSVMQLVWDTIVPAFNDASLPANPAAAAKLAANSKKLKLVHDNKPDGN